MICLKTGAKIRIIYELTAFFIKKAVLSCMRLGL